MPSTDTGRLVALDGLRTVAIVLVVTYHAFPSTLRGGAIGVDLFFVISGLVITQLLWTEFQRLDRVLLGRFYLNRMLRLWPALLIVTVTTLVASLLIPGLAETTRWVAPAATYLSDIFEALSRYESPAEMLGHTWSLAVEEQFYLLWAPLFALLFVVLRTRPKAVFGALLGLAMVPTLERALLWVDAPTSFNRIYFAPEHPQ